MHAYICYGRLKVIPPLNSRFTFLMEHILVFRQTQLTYLNLEAVAVSEAIKKTYFGKLITFL